MVARCSDVLGFWPDCACEGLAACDLFECFYVSSLLAYLSVSIFLVCGLLECFYISSLWPLRDSSG